MGARDNRRQLVRAEPDVGLPGLCPGSALEFSWSGCNMPVDAGVSGRVQQVTQEPRPATYAALVGWCAPALLRLSLMLTGDPHDAEDLLQATLLRGIRHGDRIVAMEAPVAY